MSTVAYDPLKPEVVGLLIEAYGYYRINIHDNPPKITDAIDHLGCIIPYFIQVLTATGNIDYYNSLPKLSASEIATNKANLNREHFTDVIAPLFADVSKIVDTSGIPKVVQLLQMLEAVY